MLINSIQNHRIAKEMHTVQIPSTYQKHGLSIVVKDGEIFYSKVNRTNPTYLAMALSNMPISASLGETFSFDKIVEKSRTEYVLDTYECEGEGRYDFIYCQKCNDQMEIICNCKYCCNSQYKNSKYCGSKCKMLFRCNKCNPSFLTRHEKPLFCAAVNTSKINEYDYYYEDGKYYLYEEAKQDLASYLCELIKYDKMNKHLYKIMISQKRDIIDDDDDSIDKHFTQRIYSGTLQHTRNFFY